MGFLSSLREREFDTELSIERAYAFAARNELNLDVSTVGREIHTTTCEITGSSGRRSTGRGKGLGNQSRASAIFEALEHYFYDSEPLSEMARVKHLDLAVSDIELSEASPDFDLICGNHSVKLGRLPFFSVNDSAPIMEFPAVLVNPGYEPIDPEERKAITDFRLKRYSTNSGTASGLTKWEAILHGLLECIERDSIGIELLSTVVANTGLPARVIAAESMPDAIVSLSAAAAQETGGTITLWDITSDLGIPTILCSVLIGGHQYFGSGSSLYSSYAAERAILEAVQGFHVQNLCQVDFQRPMKRDINKMSIYQRCNLDDGYFLFRHGSEEVQFPNTKSFNVAPSEPKEQVALITDRLSAVNIPVFFRHILADEIFVSQVVVPKLERFYLVSHGIPVAPASRGRKFIHSMLNGKNRSDTAVSEFQGGITHLQGLPHKST